MTNMRFGTFQWTVNPIEIRVQGGRRVREGLFPAPALWEDGPALRSVSGRGFFTGPEAASHFTALHARMEAGGADTLLLPEYGPMRAVLTELKLLRGSLRLIEYAFFFRECPARKQSVPCAEPSALLGRDETLWRLAARLSIPIERLLACNPEIADPWSAGEGTEVRLP